MTDIEKVKEPKVDEPKVEAKVEIKEEPKVEVEVKVETKDESKVESKVEPKVEVKVETKDEPKVESKVESKVEAKDEIKEEPKVESKVETKVDSLTSEQQKAVDQLYETVKKNCESIIDSFHKQQTSEALFLTYMTGQIIKQVEQTSCKGVDKKQVALQIGRNIIKDAIKDVETEQKVLLLFDIMGSPMIDHIVDITKNVNVNSVSSISSISPPKSCCVIM